jgi:plasmid stabilization system protein ParE
VAAASVRFHPAAVREAIAAYDWYAARSLAAARGFREELTHALDAVTEDPERWPRYGANARRYLFPRFPFSLIYRVRDDEVEVLAVAHGKRRPGYWQSRAQPSP